MKRLWIVAIAALLTVPARMKAEGPDDKYIQIYKMILEGDQLAGTSQRDLARQRYADAQTELKKLQASYPNWNQKLIEFRLRMVESKLAPIAQPTPPPTPAPAPAVAPAPGPKAPSTPAKEQTAVAPTPTIPATVPTPARPVVEADDRDNQIKTLREQVGQLQNDKSVFEAKLREALAAQPAVLDPRELAKAEQRITALEKEKEVLRVSLQAAEAKAAQSSDSGAGELKKALADNKQKLTEQNDVIVALRQEKEILQLRLKSAPHSDDEMLKTLRTENESLKMKLAEKPAPSGETSRGAAQMEKELASTKSALQSSRDTVASLQVRMRTLQEERDRLEKTRKDLETKLAAAPPLPVPATPAETAQVRRLQKERDELQKKLTETTRQLADNKKGKSARLVQPTEDVSALRARLAALEASKVPYTAEELALFKKPQEPVAFVKLAAETKPAKELPEAAAPMMAEAQRAMTARRFDEAEKKYLEVLQLDDKNVGTLQRLAAAQLEQSRPKDAEANLKNALNLTPADPRSLLLMGIAKFDQDKFDDALDYFSRSAQLDPQNAETQNYLGITLSQKGQRAAAETALRKAVQLSPNYKEAHYNLAVVYATQQPPFVELARWHYQKAIAYGHPQNPELEKLMERKQAGAQK